MPHTETKLESRKFSTGMSFMSHWTPSVWRMAAPACGRSCTTTAEPACCLLMTRAAFTWCASSVMRLERRSGSCPLGKLEPGEDPFESARRELSEECGLSADNYIDLGVVYPTVGYDSEKIYLWAATGLHKGGQHLDAGEFLDVVRMPFEEALQKVLSGEIKDSKTQIGLMKYALLRGKA